MRSARARSRREPRGSRGSLTRITRPLPAEIWERFLAEAPEMLPARVLHVAGPRSTRHRQTGTGSEAVRTAGGPAYSPRARAATPPVRRLKRSIRPRAATRSPPEDRPGRSVHPARSRSRVARAARALRSKHHFTRRRPASPKSALVSRASGAGIGPAVPPTATILSTSPHARVRAAREGQRLLPTELGKPKVTISLASRSFPISLNIRVTPQLEEELRPDRGGRILPWSTRPRPFPYSVFSPQESAAGGRKNGEPEARHGDGTGLPEPC